MMAMRDSQACGYGRPLSDRCNGEPMAVIEEPGSQQFCRGTKADLKSPR
jgi:hypothetical protein